MESKIYPQLPNAPPEGGFERYNRVRDICNELRVLRERRNVSYKKYRKVTSALTNLMITLSLLAADESTAGIVTSLTVIGLPVGIILTAIGIASGVTAVILTPIAKHCASKKVKHGKK